MANFTIHILELSSRLTLFHHIISYFHKQHQHHQNGRVFLMCIQYGSQEYVPQIHHNMVVVSIYCDCLVHNMHYIVFCMLQSVINNYDLQGITYNKYKKLTITMSSDIFQLLQGFIQSPEKGDPPSLRMVNVYVYVYIYNTCTCSTVT